MTYDEAMGYINSVSWKGSRPGLERIRDLMAALGDPQDSLRFVHVAGTNGKGSFCSILSEILKKSGYRTGTFTSPYVKFFEERMCTDGVPISKDELSEITEEVKRAAERMSDIPTEFELMTAIGFIYFKRHACDIVVLEAGLGGRLDSTNIIKTPILSVITGISLDHTAILGDSIEKIAAEKAGIIKPGIPVLFGGINKTAEKVIAEHAANTGSEFYTVNRDMIKNVEYSIDGTVFDFGRYKRLRLSLCGIYQPYNAENVLYAVKILRRRGIKISARAVRRGLESARWQARFEILRRSDPCVIYDGGHNPEGVAACIESMHALFGDTKFAVLSGVMADKDTASIAEILSGSAKRAFTVTPDNPRSLDAFVYADLLRSHGLDADGSRSVYEGFAKAYKYAKTERIPLLVMGSLYLYAEATDTAEKIFTEDEK